MIEATCDLVIGELAVDALIKSSTDEWYDFRIWKLPCRDAIRYSELSDMEVEQSPIAPRDDRSINIHLLVQRAQRLSPSRDAELENM